MQRLKYALRMRPALTVVAVLALFCGFTTRASAADVAEWIPADALVVFKINNVQRVNQEWRVLFREFGLADQAPEAADPLAAFQAETGLSQGLNLEGNAAIYLANGDMEGDEPPLVIILPISDYQSFLKSFKATRDAGDGVTEVVFADGEDDEAEEVDWDADDTGFVIDGGEYALLSPMKELLKKPEAGIQFNGITAQMLEERDVIAYANFEQLGPMLIAQMQEEDARAQAKAELQQALEENEQFANLGPVLDVAINQFFTLAENFLRDASAGAATIDFTDDGIRFGGAGQFKPGSNFARMTSQLNASEDLPISAIPEGTYFVFGGGTDNRQVNQRFFEEFLEPIVKELQDIEGAEKLAEYVEVVKSQMAAAGEMRFGMLAPSGPLGVSSLVQTFTIQGGDVDTLIQTSRRAAELQPELMAMFLPPEAQDMGMAAQMKYEQNAMTVAGVSFDKVTADMDAMPQLQMVFGPEGMSSYMGKVDDKLLGVSGLSQAQITQLIESIRADEAPMAQDRGVLAIRPHLLEQVSSVFFFKPDELVRSGLGYSRQMGMNIPIQIPENLPPIGISAGPGENSFRADGFVHKDLVSSMVVAALQAQQFFGGMQEQFEEGDEEEDGM